MNILVTARSRPAHGVVVFPVFLLVAGGLGWFLAAKDAETIRAGVTVCVLMILSLVLFWVVARAQSERTSLLMILWLSFAAKMVAMAYRIYGGVLADAFAYHARGQLIAAQLAAGQWPQEVGELGTRFVRLATGVFYYVAGVNPYGISILWSWFGLLGMLLFYLAFTTAFPKGSRRLYMALIFFYPSLLIWTSSLGKDALVIMFLGMAVYGAARLHRRLDGVSLWWLGLGIAGVFVIRPHIAGIFAVALYVSLLFRPLRVGVLSPVVRLVGLGAALVAVVALVTSAGGYVGLEEISEEEVFGFIGQFQEQSARGGSAFEQVDPRTPAGAAMAIPTVLFRPFPWEIHNVHAAIASLEGMLLMALMLYRWRSLVKVLTTIPRESFLVLLVVYVLLFAFFFSAIGNFGIIARQRASQLFPLVFMLIACPPARRDVGARDASGPVRA